MITPLYETKNNYIENSIYSFTPNILLTGAIYGTDYDYKYNKNTNKESSNSELLVCDIAKIDIESIKSNFRNYLKFTRYDNEILTKESRKKYLTYLFTNKFLVQKILNSKDNDILIIDDLIKKNYEKIEENNKKIKQLYENLKPINNDISRLEEKKKTIEKKKQYDEKNKKSDDANTIKNLKKDLEKNLQLREKELKIITSTIEQRELIKDDKSKRSELLKMNSLIETTKQKVKTIEKEITSIEKKIKSLEEKTKRVKKVENNESDNLNKLLNEYLSQKEVITDSIKKEINDNKILNNEIKNKKTEILKHNIKILISIIFPQNSFYYINNKKLKITNIPSDDKNFSIKINYPIELPNINLQSLQNEYIDKYINDNIKKLYREKLILQGKSVPKEISITTAIKENDLYKNLKSQLTKEAFEKFNKEKEIIIKKEKQKIISNYEITIKREKNEKIKNLNFELQKETNDELIEEIKQKIDKLQKEKNENKIDFKEDNNSIIPIIDLKKGTTIAVTITLNVKIILTDKKDKKFTKRIMTKVKDGCKSRRNKIKIMLNKAASRKLFKTEKTGIHISAFKKQNGGKKTYKKYCKKYCKK